jgi:hypothetical protein
MRHFLDLVIRVLASMLSIEGINCVLKALGVAIYVGINGYTVALSAVLGLPGVLGLYVIGYLM